jgi:hypothetical protein
VACVHVDGVLPHVDAVKTHPWDKSGQTRMDEDGQTMKADERTKWTPGRSFLPKNVRYDKPGPNWHVRVKFCKKIRLKIVGSKVYH